MTPFERLFSKARYTARAAAANAPRILEAGLDQALASHPDILIHTLNSCAEDLEKSARNLRVEVEVFRRSIEAEAEAKPDE